MQASVWVGENFALGGGVMKKSILLLFGNFASRWGRVKSTHAKDSWIPQCFYSLVSLFNSKGTWRKYEHNSVETSSTATRPWRNRIFQLCWASVHNCIPHEHNQNISSPNSFPSARNWYQIHQVCNCNSSGREANEISYSGLQLWHHWLKNMDMELLEQHLSFAKHQMNSKPTNPNRGKFLLRRKIITYY